MIDLGATVCKLYQLAGWTGKLERWGNFRELVVDPYTSTIQAVRELLSGVEVMFGFFGGQGLYPRFSV